MVKVLIGLLLVSGCASSGSLRTWERMGPDDVECPDKINGQKVIKVCSNAAHLLICNCALV